MSAPSATIERTNYTFTEKDVKDGRKEVALRFKENKTLEDIEAEIEQLKDDLKNKILVDLRLPFAIKKELETTSAADKATINVKKIKDKDGTKIYASTKATDIKKSSFKGNITILRYS